MFVRNLLQSGQLVSLQAGEYATLVPFGLSITVQYSDKGLIQKIFLNHDESELEDVTESFLPLILRNQLIPNKISVTGGTSYVHGVFVTEDITSSLRKHPTSLQDELCQMFTADPLQFKFYAGDIVSKSVTFKGAVATRQWLSTSKFTLLPGYVIPRDLTEERFRYMVTQNYPFTYPLISSYIVYHQDHSVTYPKIQLFQKVVKSIVRSFTEIGDVIGTIEYATDDAEIRPQVVPYSTIVHFNIQPDSVVIQNSEQTIIHSISSAKSKKSERLSNKIQCSCCGKQIVVPATGNVRCTDPQCNSVLYPRVLQLCKILHLPNMTFDKYLKVSEEIGTIFSILDIFDIEPYSDMNIDVTIAQGLRAIVPKTILPGMQQINQICDECSNSLQTLQYYIQHPDKLKIDLDLDPNAFQRFFTWITDADNRSDIIEFFKLSNIHLSKQTKKFEGDPIFRNKLILVTGTFIHGSIDEVSNIFRSYAAEVTTTLSENVNCVVIGDAQENVDGHAVIEARKRRIPILTESEIFSQYDIDKDLAENL